MANADTGAGATIVFATSSFTGKYVSIGDIDQQGDALEDSALDTTTTKSYIPADLHEPGTITCEVYFDPRDTPPTVLGAAETITITYPKFVSGSMSAATFAGTGFVVRRKFPQNKINEVNVMEIEVQFDGGTGPTFTVEA